MARCDHPDFSAQVTINRLEDTGTFAADITVHCASCNEPFRWLGVPAGLSYARPMVSVDGLELRAPIEPEGEKRLFSHSRFEVDPSATEGEGHA